MKKYILMLLVGCLIVGGGLMAADVVQNFYGNSTINVNSEAERSLGGFYSPDITGLAEKTELIYFTDASGTSTITLLASDSGTTYLLKGSSTIITLPAKENGLRLKFVVSGAIDDGSPDSNYIIDSSEGDNIEGTLIVAGAVVDCDAEDQINIVSDGENVGDYVELYSDGTSWLIGDSGALTTAKMTCTDP